MILAGADNAADLALGFCAQYALFILLIRALFLADLLPRTALIDDGLDRFIL